MYCDRFGLECMAWRSEDNADVCQTKASLSQFSPLTFMWVQGSSSCHRACLASNFIFWVTQWPSLELSFTPALLAAQLICITALHLSDISSPLCSNVEERACLTNQKKVCPFRKIMLCFSPTAEEWSVKIAAALITELPPLHSRSYMLRDCTQSVSA